MATIHHMTCCVCGAYAGRWEQHWNRDTGYGICKSCAVEQRKRETPEEHASLYGLPGVNYEVDGKPLCNHCDTFGITGQHNPKCTD